MTRHPRQANHLIALIALLGVTLCGCGGGGSATSTTPVSPTPVTPTSDNKAMASTIGDFYTYRQTYTLTPDTLPPAYDFTDHVSALSTTGKTVMTTYSNDYINSTETIDSDGKSIRLDYIDGCSYKYSPAIAIYFPLTLSLDTSWDVNTSRTFSCTNSTDTTIDAINVKGHVQGSETVTVSAGTFNTVKIVSRRTQTRATSTLVNDKTCWVEPTLGVKVRCEYVSTSTTTSTPSTTTVYKSNDELSAYSHAASKRHMLGAARFAGGWGGVFSGADHGYCTIKILESGELSGSCTSTGMGGVFSVSGSVDAQGTLVFRLSANGSSTPTFTGTLESPAKMGGTWMMSNGGSGTWSLLHN